MAESEACRFQLKNSSEHKKRREQRNSCHLLNGAIFINELGHINLRITLNSNLTRDRIQFTFGCCRSCRRAAYNACDIQ